ncbi:MAG: hypothetical protein ABWY29_11020 [Blastococcus sp.]
MTDDERRHSGGLIDPHVVADTVVGLALDQTANGRVVVLRAGIPPYDLDPGRADPHQI